MQATQGRAVDQELRDKCPWCLAGAAHSLKTALEHHFMAFMGWGIVAIPMGPVMGSRGDTVWSLYHAAEKHTIFVRGHSRAFRKSPPSLFISLFSSLLFPICMYDVHLAFQI